VELRVSFAEEMDPFQICADPPGESRLTGLNLFRLPDVFMVNFILEDSAHIYPYLFSEIRLSGGQVEARLPRSLAGAPDLRNWIEEAVGQLKARESSLGLHASVVVVDHNSFLGDFLGRQRNIHRAPYVGVCDVMSQRKTYEFYAHIATQLGGRGLLVADIGCGSGYGSHILARRGFTVVGIDVDPMAIDFARRLPPSPGVSFELTDVLRMAEKGKLFDAAVLVEVLEHVEDPRAFFRDLLRLVKPGGAVALTLPMWRYHGIDLNSDHRTNWTLPKARRFISTYGQVDHEAVVAVQTDPRRYAVESSAAEPEQVDHAVFVTRPAPPRSYRSQVKRVLLVCHSVPPYEHTGTPIRTWEYARQLRRLGFTVGVVAASASPAGTVDTREGITVYLVPRLPWGEVFLDGPADTDRRVLKPFEKVLVDFAPDIVHFVDYVFMPVQVVQLASDYGARVIRHVWNDEEICFRTSPVIPEHRRLCSGPERPEKCARCILLNHVPKNRIFTLREEGVLAGKLHAHHEYIRYLYDLIVDGVIFPSESFSQHFTRFVPISPAKVCVIPHGVRRPAKVRTRSGTGGKITFGFIGQIAFRKGIDVLAKALVGLDCARLDLRLYGKVHDQQLLEKIVARAGVRYMGAYDPSDLEAVLEEIDVGIVPSYFETYSRVVREFLVHGIPVLSAGFYGSEIIRDGYNGFRFEVGDHLALRELMERITCNPALVAQLSEGAAATAVPTPEQEVEQIVDFYRRVFGESRRGLSGESPDHQEAACEGRALCKPAASVIIPVHNNWTYTQRCLLSLEQTGVTAIAEVIVVDNGSTDETPVALSRDFPWVKVLRNEENLGFAVACNQGAAAAEGRHLVFLNNDTEVKPGWLESLMAAAEADRDVGIVGSKLLFPDGRIQHAGVKVHYGAPDPIMPVHERYGAPDDGENTAQEADAVTGASMLVRRRVFEAVGGFDERYRNGYEDVDLCFKVKQLGYRIVYEPRSVAVHYESRTPGRYDDVQGNTLLLHRLWMPLVSRMRPAKIPPVRTGRPGVSVVSVTYNSLRTVAPFVESVLASLFPGDELIVVDNGSRDETAYYLEQVASVEQGRIAVVPLPESIGYAAAAAKGIRLAKNEYIVFLDPDTVVFGSWVDDLLDPMLRDEHVGATGPVSNHAAGLQNVSTYLELPGAQATLEKIREELESRWRGKTVDTKLLMGFCLAIRKSVLENVGGLDESLFLGNHDLDLSWRLQRAGFRQLVVPSVFVLRQGQVSSGREPRVRTAYLVQQNTNQLYERLCAASSGSPPSGRDLWGIDRFRPQEGLLSIIMPVHRDAVATRRSLESIVRNTHRPYEIIVIDNAADAETRSVIEAYAGRVDNFTIVTNEFNLGYPVACNQGLARARGEYLVVMNNDVVVPPHWASRLLAAFSVDPKVGAVGPRTNYAAGPQLVENPDYTEQTFPAWAEAWYRKNAGYLRPAVRLIGFLMVLKRQLVEEIGGFDPLFGIGNYEDDDYCLRALIAGYKLVIADDVFVHHFGSRCFREQPGRYAALLETNRRLFAAKWGLSMRGCAYDALEVLGRAGYAREDLFVPLSFEAMFSRELQPLDLGTTATFRLLCIPDPSDVHGTWLELVRNYLATFGPGDGTALIVRVEPSDEEWLGIIVDSVQRVAEDLRVDLAHHSDVIVEARRIPSAERGRIYRAATAFVPLPGVRRESLIREARASGIPVLSGHSTDELRRTSCTMQAARRPT
jgi:GT2 family glycosyltransferase/glycosyltransferase involved in cell wall biosynthesis/ubiquinone/menaquinone biosynthesis C-methylase UbiE